MICFRHFCWKWPEGPGHVLCFSFLCNFALTWLEHLHHLLNFCCNFHCNALGHCKYATIFDLTHCDIHSPWLFLSSFGGVAKSYITLMPPVMCMDWLCWRYNHAADVVPPLTALVILTYACSIHFLGKSVVIGSVSYVPWFSVEYMLTILRVPIMW